MPTSPIVRRPPTRHEARAALGGSAFSNASMVALALLLSVPTVWAVVATLGFVAGVAVAVLVGRMVPPVSPRETSEVTRAAGLAVVPVTALYLLLEVAAVAAVGLMLLLRVVGG